jgi:hypothetical protein
MPPNTPDFDSMSPEEVMAWMESLAKRQGASEGFTTSADMDIEEVDPSTVIDEPGYVPFGEETRKPAAKVAPEPEPEPEPITELDMEVPADLDTGGMAWLESLAADQSGDFPQMDLAALSAELEPSDETEPIETTPSLDWLDSLAEAPETASPAVDDIAAIEDPIAAGIDPMVWLESLAKRQGARADELTTAADLDIPTPEGVEDTGPGYEDFTVESSAQPEREAADPAAWLESMTTGSTFHIDTSDVAADEEAMSDEDIQAALSSGVDIPPDQMEAFLGRQLDRQLSGGDVPIPTAEDYDPDAPPVPAELPDWLLEQVQPPDTTEAVGEPDHQPALLDEIVAPPDIEAELPDWLQAEEDQEADSALESIFESAAAVAEPGIDASDPWVQAFTEEADTDPDAIPEWYARNVNDPERIAAVEKQLMTTNSPPNWKLLICQRKPMYRQVSQKPRYRSGCKMNPKPWRKRNCLIGWSGPPMMTSLRIFPTGWPIPMWMSRPMRFPPGCSIRLKHPARWKKTSSYPPNLRCRRPSRNQRPHQNPSRQRRNPNRLWPCLNESLRHRPLRISRGRWKRRANWPEAAIWMAVCWPMKR